MVHHPFYSVLRTFIRLFMILVAIQPTLYSAAQGESATIQNLDLSGEWSFTYTAEATEAVPAGSAFTANMPVPGCWDDTFTQEQARTLWPDAKINPSYKPLEFPIYTDNTLDGSLPFLYGTGWYRKSIDVPSEWQGRQITLNMGYVVAEAVVYVNGKPIHHHVGHSTAWQVPLGEFLSYGTSNDLVLAVQNTRSIGGCRLRGWKGRSGGIFGPVSLKISGPARIADLYVYPDSERLHWQAELEGNLASCGSIEWTVRDPQTRASLASGSQQADQNHIVWTTDFCRMNFWSDREPKLYILEITLLDKQKQVIDQHSQSFGRRRLTPEGMGLKLNGTPIYLRGVCEHAYFPETCTPPVNVEFYRKILSRYKEIGFNWLRFHTWVPSEPYMQAADELGFLIQVEGPSGFTMPEWIDILKACRKHPSVVIYCGGNEQVLDEKSIPFFRDCAMEQKRLVPDGLFNPMAGERGITRAESDQEEWETPAANKVMDPVVYIPSRLKALQEFCDVFNPYAWGDLSYSTIRNDARWIDYRTKLYEKPVLSHEVGIIGAYLDLSLAPRYQNTRIGTRLFDAAREQLRQAGLLDRAETYYRNSAAWQRILRKDALEKARFCKTIAGYDYLGAIDTHWHRTGYETGILNEFGECKHGDSVEQILTHNNESILMISESMQRNVYYNEVFSRSIRVSWFNPQPLQEGTLRWSVLASDGTVLKEGTESVPPVQTGQIADIADIGFKVPELDKAQKVLLRVELSSKATALKNEWEFWIFPDRMEPKESNVRIVESIDQKTFARLLQGDNVLLLGFEPFPAQKITFQMGTAGRPLRNFATVIEKHPLMDAFPHDGWCSWQFYPMMQTRHGSAVQFNDLDVPFDPIVEMVSSYKYVRKQGMIFEYRVGKGKLLVCSLYLNRTDPGGNHLYNCLCNYASSEKFQPRHEMPAETMAKLLNLDLNLMEIEKTDEGFDPRSALPEPPKK